MKTVATKLDSGDYDIFISGCNDDGCTPASKLRQLIKNSINNKLVDVDSDSFVIDVERPKPTVTIIDDKPIKYEDGIPRPTVTIIDG